MDILDKYQEALINLYNYFDYEEGWQVYPIDDRRHYFWHITHNFIHFYDTREAYETEDGMHTYIEEIILGEIYHKDDFTAILVNTQTDGNKFLAIYDNSKRLHENA